MQQFIAIMFSLLGSVALIASILNQDWFFSSQNASFLVSRIGRNGARIAYGFIGLLMIIVGILILFFITVR